MGVPRTKTFTKGRGSPSQVMGAGSREKPKVPAPPAGGPEGFHRTLCHKHPPGCQPLSGTTLLPPLRGVALASAFLLHALAPQSGTIITRSLNLSQGTSKRALLSSESFENEAASSGCTGK